MPDRAVWNDRDPSGLGPNRGIVWGVCGLLTPVPYIGWIAALIFLVYSCFLCSSHRVRGMSRGIFVGVIIGIVLIVVMGNPELAKGMQNFFDRR